MAAHGTYRPSDVLEELGTMYGGAMKDRSDDLTEAEVRVLGLQVRWLELRALLCSDDDERLHEGQVVIGLVQKLANLGVRSFGVGGAFEFVCRVLDWRYRHEYDRELVAAVTAARHAHADDLRARYQVEAEVGSHAGHVFDCAGDHGRDWELAQLGRAHLK